MDRARLTVPDHGRLPDFLIIGAMRSGTTALSNWLGQHPDVFIAPGKELHFFDRHFDMGVDWYRSQFKRAGEATRLAEATPNYLHEPEAIERISQVIPEVKLLIILRNPVDRAYSHYWHNQSRGKESLSFAEAIEAEQARISSDKANRAFYSYASRGHYITQLDEVLSRFRRSALHVEIAEEFFSDPERRLPIIFRFLDIDPTFVPSKVDERINRFVEFRSVRLRAFSKRLPGVAAGVIGRLNVRSGSDYPPMEPIVRAHLESVFERSNQRLATLLDRTGPIWG